MFIRLFLQHDLQKVGFLCFSFDHSFLHRVTDGGRNKLRDCGRERGGGIEGEEKREEFTERNREG
jgi:hypothetical protein